MKTFLKTALCLAAGIMFISQAGAQDKKIDPTGKWIWTQEGRGGGGGMRTNTLVLKLEGEKLTGTLEAGGRGGRGGGQGGQGGQGRGQGQGQGQGGQGRGQGRGFGAPANIENAKISGNEISFQITREFGDNKMVSKYTAKITGDTMKGKQSFDRNGEVTEREFEAKREAAK